MLIGATSQPPEVDIAPGDVAILQYIGGTTGVSKGAMLTHRNLVANILQTCATNPAMPTGTDLRVLTVLPLFHAYDMTVCMNMGLSRSGELTLLPHFDPAEVLRTIKVTQTRCCAACWSTRSASAPRRLPPASSDQSVPLLL